MKAFFAPFADEFFVAAIELDGFIKPITQRPYGRPFRTQASAIKEAQRFLGLMNPREKARVEASIREEASS